MLEFPRGLHFYFKQTPTQVFSYEISKLAKNTFFCRTSPVAASEKNEQQQLFESVAKSC